MFHLPIHATNHPANLEHALMSDSGNIQRKAASKRDWIGSPANSTNSANPANSANSSSSADAIGHRASAYPKAIDKLIAHFAQLPGIGRRSAERLAFHIVKSSTEDALALARAISDAKLAVRSCKVCWNLSDGESCEICEDARRDRATVLVVEQPKDLIWIEQTNMFKGVYHVLMGRLSPLEGIGPGDLTARALLERVADASLNCGGIAVHEVVLGLNPTVEGDGTAMYLSDRLRIIKAADTGEPIRVTRLARGVPAGSQLEYANKAVLADAIVSRQLMNP